MGSTTQLHTHTHTHTHSYTHTATHTHTLSHTHMSQRFQRGVSFRVCSGGVVGCRLHILGIGRV